MKQRGKIAGQNLIFFFKTISHEKCTNNRALYNHYNIMYVFENIPCEAHSIIYYYPRTGPSALFLLFVIPDESLTLIKFCIFFFFLYAGLDQRIFRIFYKWVVPGKI